MSPEVISKFANKILRCDDPAEAISISNYQFHYFCNEEDYIAYFSLLSESNLIYSVLLYFNYSSQHKVKISQVENILIAAIRKSSISLQGDQIDLRLTTNTTKNQMTKSITDINHIADLCISDIIINKDDSLHYSVFYKNVRRIKRREDGYGIFLNRCGELLSHLDDCNRCIYTIILIGKLIYFCNDEDNRVLALILKSLSNRPLHFFGPISKQIINCIKKLYGLNDPFVLQQLLELFPQINFSMLSTNLPSFLKRIEERPSHIEYEKYVIKLIACAETLNSRENKSISDLGFKDTVFQQYEAEFEKNTTLKDTVNLRFICKSIADDPQNIDDYLTEIDGTENFFVRSISDMEQSAFNALVSDNPSKLKVYLNWLDNANAYKLNVNVRSTGINYFIRIPGMRNIADLCKSQLERLSAYCSIDDLVFIYFNSHIRVYLPVEELMKIIYEKSPKKRDDYMIVKNTFDKYVIKGNLIFDKSGEAHFTTEQFCTNSPYLSVTGYERINKESLEKIRNQDGGVIHFIIKSFNVVAGFNPQITLLSNDRSSNLMKDKRETINFYSDYLEQIAEKKCFTDDDISVLRGMPFKLLKGSDFALFGMNIIHCCHSFNDNLMSICFLKQVYSNPFKIRSQFSAVPMGIDIGEYNFQLCIYYVRRMLDGNGALEEWLYLYFNTLLRSVYYFDSFLIRLAGVDIDLDLWMLYDVYGIKLHGKISDIKDTVISIFPLSFRLSNEWQILCPMPDDFHIFNEKDIITFDLYGADIERKIIYAENISKTSIRNTYFCAGMNKAKLTLDLDRYDIRNLLQTPSGLNVFEIKKLAMNEIEAIKLRVSNSERTKDFLSVIHDSNPWSFSESLLPCIVSVNDSNKYLIESAINDLVDYNSIDFAVMIYFNTSLKSAFTVDKFVRILVAKYKDTNKVFATLSPYTIVILGFNENTQTSSNSNLEPLHYLELKPGKYSIVGYDKDKHLVKLKRVL